MCHWVVKKINNKKMSVETNSTTLTSIADLNDPIAGPCSSSIGFNPHDVTQASRANENENFAIPVPMGCSAGETVFVGASPSSNLLYYTCATNQYDAASKIASEPASTANFYKESYHFIVNSNAAAQQCIYRNDNNMYAAKITFVEIL